MATPRSTKRDDIVDAAARLFRTRGVHATSVADIIAASGTSAGSVYHHFSSKNDVVLAVADRAIVGPLRHILAERGDGALSPGDLLRLVVQAVFAGEVESALIVQLWAGSAQEPLLKDVLREHLGGVREQMTAELARWLTQRGVPDAEARAEGLAMITMGQAMGLLAQRTIMPDLDQSAYLTHATRMLDAAASV